MKNLTKLFIALLVLATLGTACSKYHGFKKNKLGFYYKFYEINKKEQQPELGDYVELTFTMRILDSVLIDNSPLSEMIIESLYPGDIFAAIQTLHLGDSATFIMDGPDFFQHFLGRPYPFEQKELYFDMKLNNIIPKEDFEAMQEKREREYYEMIDTYRDTEDSLINDYVSKNMSNIKPTAEGLYIKKTFSGNGKKIENGSKVLVHYTGKFLSGSVFDSSVDSEPIQLTVGQGQVIPGWERTLLLMRGGDKVTVLIPSKLAYGSRGAEYVIMPYTPLLFDMEVMEVE